ncbi:hypothetical protein CQA49_09800, partial [Helicobacter sp. MIT 00-7814]
GGKWQGVQQASTTTTLGATFENGKDIVRGNTKEHVSGEALAKTLGTDSAVKTIAQASGLQGSMAYDRDGSLNGGREGSYYAQGLENNARIAANQVIGVGKEGALNTQKMNAIQYGGHAGVINQIEQGQALQTVHGTGSNFASSYKSTARTNAEASLIQAREGARALRDEYSDLTGGKGNSSLADTHYLNTTQGLQSQVGKAKGFNEATDGGNIRTAEHGSKLENLGGLKSTEATL